MFKTLEKQLRLLEFLFLDIDLKSLCRNSNLMKSSYIIKNVKLKLGGDL